jgi:hypothetical protein
MITADGLKDQNGRLLVPAGTVIAASHLRALSRWGVTAVPVVDDGAVAEPALPAPTPERIAEAEVALRSVFRRADLRHPLLAAVWRSCVTREASRIGGGHRA